MELGDLKMAATYEPIQTQTLASNQASVVFSNISQSYTDLVLVCTVASSSTNTVFIRFNGDTATNYSASRLYGSGSVAGSDRDTNAAYGLLTNYAWPTSTVGDSNVIVSIPNYNNSIVSKTWISRANRAAAGVDAIVGLWRPANAITQISLSTNGFAATTTLLSGSIFTLYGIKAA